MSKVGKISGKDLRSLKKQVKKQNAKTDLANAKFESMSRAEKRVYIARDVLAQLASGRIRAVSGCWVSRSNDKGLFSETDISKNKEVKDVLDTIKTCNACALGGLFVSTVCLADNLKIKELDNSPNEKDPNNWEVDENPGALGFNSIKRYLTRFFSQKQLDLIELAFEIGEGAATYDGSDAAEDALNFFSDILGDDLTNSDVDDSVRMRLIMENITVHKGTFKPSVRPQLVTTFITPGFTS